MRVMRGSRPLVVLSSLVLVTAATVMFVRQMQAPWEYDESYNMTVAQNLVRSGQYSTNGVVTGEFPSYFDQHITTGPAVLLPAAVAWWVTGGAPSSVRLLMFGFFLLWAVCAWLLLRSELGPLGRLTTLAVPLTMLMPHDSGSGYFAAGRVVGEIPTAAFLIAAVLPWSMRRPLLMGLFLGLAIQSKVLAVVPAVVILLVVSQHLLSLRQLDRSRVGRIAVGVALPTLSFELLRLGVLGSTGWVRNWDRTLEFYGAIRSMGSEPGYEAVDKLASLGGLFRLSALVFFVLLLAVAGIGLLRTDSDRAIPRDSGRASESSVAIRALLMASTASFILWLVVVQERSGRHGIPAVLLALVPLAILIRRSLAPWLNGVRTSSSSRVLIVLGVLIIVGWNALDGVSGDTAGRERMLQSEAVRLLIGSDSPSLRLQGWGQEPDIQLLTGIPIEGVQTIEPATILVFSKLRAKLELGIGDARLYESACGEPLLVEPEFLVCRVP
jgi:hypothetical protein